MSPSSAKIQVRFVLLCSLLILGAIVGCEKSPSPVEPAMDWSDIYLTVTGHSRSIEQERLGAMQDAKQEAYSRLEEQIVRLKINPKQDVGMLLQKDKKLKDKLDAFIRRAKVVSTEFLPASNQMSVTVELYLGADFKAALGIKEKSKQEQRSPSGAPSGLGILQP